MGGVAQKSWIAQVDPTPVVDPPQQEQIDPNLLMMAVGLGVMGILYLVLKGFPKKGVLGRARFANAKEIQASREATHKTITARKHNEVGLWIGQPRKLIVDHHRRTIDHEIDSRSLYFNQLQEHLLTLGSTGSGKSFSILDPLKRAAILLGYPIIDFDFKGHEESYEPGNLSLAPSSATAGFAEMNDYKVYVIAPGFPDSDRLNPLSFLNGPTDAANGYQLANVLNANFQLTSENSGSDFFSMAGNQLIQALMMMCKGIEQGADIATSHKILALPELIKRIQQGNFSQYQKVAFDNYLSSAGSPETAASIATTASIMFSRFMVPEILSVFCGETTVPLDITGRTMVIFRMDPRIEFAVSPLIASTIYLMLSRNIYSTRKDPILAFLDEIPRIKIPKLSDLMNIARSNGGCFFLGAQGLDLMEGTFGAKETGSILDACKTQAIGQLVGGRSSNFYSEKIFGKEDVRVRNTNRNHGHKNKSRGDSENVQTRPLVEAQDLQQLFRGDFFFLSPSVGNKRRVRIPFRYSVRIPDHELKQMQDGKDWWRDTREERIARSKAKPLTDAQLLAREYLANDLFPSVQTQAQAQDYADGVDSLLATALAEH